MTFDRPSKPGRIALGSQPLKTFELYRQTSSTDDEAGGILLGRLLEGTADIVIDLASTPNTGDRRGRFRFFRQKDPTQRLIDAEWQNSGGTRIYLGEWHSHPEDIPQPSAVDLTNWNRLVRNARYEQESLLFSIVGRQRIRFWEIGQSGRDREECRQTG